MARYIDADRLLKNLCDDDLSKMEDFYYNAILNTPTADVVEVKHGEWIYEYSGECLTGTDAPLCCKCSECGNYTVDEENYCPNCGAKMDGKPKKEG